MIFPESMYHNMQIHVIFLPLYFLPCPNLIRPPPPRPNLKRVQHRAEKYIYKCLVLNFSGNLYNTKSRTL